MKTCLRAKPRSFRSAIAITTCVIGATAFSAFASEPEDDSALVAGSLPQWSAARDDFWQYLPHDGVVAPLQTTMRVACDANNLLIRVDAVSEAGAAVKSPRVRRDQVLDDQDHVTVFIDPSNRGSSAMFFRVGAGGSISDGIYYSSSNRQDLQPDFNVRADVEPTENGYRIDLQIPRSLLAARGQLHGNMSYLVLRSVPGRTRRVFASSRLDVNTTNLIARLRTLNASACAAPVASTSSTVTYTVNGNEVRTNDQPRRDYDRQLGASVQWSNGSTTSADITYNPDFSQVELDVPQLQSNTRFAINLPEKREFFLRDTDLFELPTRTSLNDGGGNQLFYSRTITDPDWGGRFAYRGGVRDYALLVASDNGGGMVSIPGPFFTRFAPQGPSQVVLARAAMSAKDSLRYGVIAADRRYDSGVGRNSILGADLTWQPIETLRSRAMAVQSRTDAAFSDDRLRRSESSPGSYFFWDLVATGRRWETAWTAERASKDFRNDVGYTPQANFLQVAGLITRRWRPDAAINNIGASLKIIGSDTVSTGELINRKVAAGIWFGGARDLDLFVEYVPGERRRTSGYGGHIHTTNQWNFRFGGNFHRGIPWAGLSLNVGDQIDYGIDRVGTGYTASLSARLRPTDWLELQPTFYYYRVEHNSINARVEETSGQIIANAIIGPSSFIRYIGQTRGNRRFAPPSTEPGGTTENIAPWLLYDNRSVLHSLVYSTTRDHKWRLDIGLTRSRFEDIARNRVYESNAFAKVEGYW